ncbi:MAG: hypothetical protein ACR2P5_04715 [Gammaproteobacteria bacterium]
MTKAATRDSGQIPNPRFPVFIPSDVEARLQKLFALRPSVAFPPNWSDLENIWRLLNETQPTTILEFGSGCSTAVIWLWLQRNKPGGCFFSLESDPIWYAANQHMIAEMGMLYREDYEPRGGLLFSPVETRSPPFLHYTYQPLESADFVYIDGPALHERSRVVDNVADLHPLPECVLVDGRPWQVEMLRAHLLQTHEMEADDDAFRAVFKRREEKDPQVQA